MKQKLLHLTQDKIRLKHYSIQTEKSHTDWIKRFIFFHNKKHLIEVSKVEIEEFLTFLAVDKKVASSTQNKPWRFTK